jgi:hypothetical protein
VSRGPYQKVDLAERFWQYVERTEGCWLWRASTSSDGYGQIEVVEWEGDTHRRRSLRAHRVAYELTYGPVPPSVLVLHSCDNRLCCRPDHLHLGNYSENLREAWARGRRHGWTRDRKEAERVSGGR